MRLKFSQILTALALGVFALSTAQADIVENFDYPNGDLVGNGSPAWTNHSGSGSFIQVDSGAAVLQQGGGSREDAGINFNKFTTGTLTASFDLVVNDDAGWSNTDFEYFAHFMESGSFNFRSRLDIVAPVGAGDYSVGISSGTSTAETVTTSTFNFGDTVSVVLEFDLDTGIGSATVGGETIVGTGSFTGETLNRFALRQADSGADETIRIDNLRIVGAVIPEPTSAGLLALVAGFGVIRRRK